MLNRRLNRHIFSVIYNAIRKQTALVFAWRFIFVFYIFIHLLLGQSPFTLISKYIRANNSDLRVINLYANSSRVSFNSYGKGWDRDENSHSAPSVSGEARAEEFDADNSSVYTGGDEVIVLGDFWFLEEEFFNEELKIKNEELVINEDFEIEIATTSEQSIDDIGDEEVDIKPETVASTTIEDGIISEEIMDNENVEIIATTTDLQISTTSDIEIVEDNFIPYVEILDIEEPTSTVEIKIASSAQEIELPYDFDNLLGVDEVGAQEFVTSEINNLSELGNLEEAKIFLSLAIRQNKKQGELILYEDLDLDYDNLIEVATGTDIEIEPSGSLNDETIETSTTSIDVVEIESFSSSTVEIIGEEDISDSSTTVSWLNKILDIKDVKAQNQLLDDASLSLWYSLGEKDASSTDLVWQLFDTITKDNISNYTNNGYLSFDAPFLSTFNDIENLEIKIEGHLPDGTDLAVYLDALWIEAAYNQETELDKLKKRERWENALELISESLVFGANEKGELEFKYNKNEEQIWDTLKEIMGLGNFWQDVEINAELIDSKGQKVEIPLIIIFESDGSFSVRLSESRELQPGEYTIKFHIEDNSGEEIEIFDLSQEFSWGVLAMNFNKHEYTVGEEGYVQMAVLDKLGHTECGAFLQLKIKNEKLKIEEVFSTESGTIDMSSECGPETVTDMPDYSLHYQFEEAGEYIFELTSNTAEGEKTINETIKVVDDQAIGIERTSATRIYPKEDYTMMVLIRVWEDFRGDITEVVPSGFKIKNEELRIKNSNERDPYGSEYRYIEVIDGDVKKMTWRDVDLKAGDELEIKYIYDAPNESPKLFLVGGLEMLSAQGELIIGRESRSWQIASDAVTKRARTVMFLGGNYSGNGGTGQNSDTNQTFSQFNFRLAESGVDIKSAFVIFESQYEAYANNAGNYTGYNLAFDACEESCTADAFSGTNRVLQDDNSVLSYDEIASNQVRLLFDISSESELAAYTGNSTEMEAQIGYRLERGSAVNSIASARSILVLTYTYDVDAENITNTVIYPLDSSNTTPSPSDSGSRQDHQEGDCTLGTDCPRFSYNVEIPEFPGYATSTFRLSQWQTYHEINDNHGSTDIRLAAQVYGESTPSSYQYLEAALAGTQGNVQNMVFDTLTGYSENIAQEIEYQAYTNNTGHDHAIQGGEIFETYIASSSAAVKTRTVKFPLGVLSGGATDNAGYASTDVYFGENGTATGTVEIKSAWFRIISQDYSSGGRNVSINTKVGSMSTSSTFSYEYNPGGTVKTPMFKIFQIIESANYAELEEANSESPVNIGLYVANDQATVGITSAELVITYTYSSENKGYLSNLDIFAGQSGVDPGSSTTTPTDNSVMPETGGKVILGASINASFLNSDSLGNVGAGITYDIDAGLSTSTPTCSATGSTVPDAVNAYFEIYKDVTNAMDTTDDQAYYACYKDDETLIGTDGAKMGGILTYTYIIDNLAPTSTIDFAGQKSDGSGTVDLTIGVRDTNGDDLSAKLEYEAGTVCAFGSPLDPDLDETDSNITADYNDPNIENDNEYQVGTPASYIELNNFYNRVYFDWLSKEQLGAVEGDYCLRLTVNDGITDQLTPATTTVYIDHINPSAPGALSLSSRTGTTMTLNFGATSTDTNFNEYKIIYKIADGTYPRESDSVMSSTSDNNLSDQLFLDAATTTVSGLSASTTYSFAIWAYDDYGNRASSSYVNITTNDAPIGKFDFYPTTRQKTDGSGIVEISVKIDDANNQDTVKAKLEYIAGTSCDFSTPLDPTLDPASISTSFGLSIINDSAEYQIGQPGGWIITSPGENTVGFNWLGKTDEASADGYYCLRLTANDRFDDQLTPTTTIIKLDNVDPVSTGNLTIEKITTNSVTLVYATNTPATDTNEPLANAYKIFYKQGTSGVTVNNTEHDNSDLDAYDYNSATSTKISGLDSNTWYVFNIWSFDSFGNRATATEVSIKTNATLSNNSLSFTNALSEGADHNIALAGTTTEWNLRAIVNETNGWYAIGSTTLRLADNYDNSPTYKDLAFRWNQSTQSFSDVGTDALGAVTLSPNSTSTCAVNTCTLDFKLVINKNFASSSVEYSATLMSDNDFGIIDIDNYSDFYQVRFPYVVQTHYRWRYDDGGE
jgi:hypothetical protein